MQYKNIISYIKLFICVKCKAKGIVIDYESCFGDGDYRKHGNIVRYKEEFLDAHMIGYEPYDTVEMLRL